MEHIGEGRTHLLGVRIPDRVDERAELVAHGLGGHTGGGGLEVNMGRAADASVEGVALGHEGVGGHGSARGVSEKKDGGGAESTYGWLMWTGFVVFVEMRRGRLGVERERMGGARGRW